MSTAVRQERDGAVAILTIDAPPVNALGAAVRAGLAEGLAAALADPGVGAIVLRAVGATFSAGADIREFGKPVADVPALPDLCRRIEASAKPVIAAVQGAALGGGMELVLAAHVRLAGPGARFGLPEVNLGLLPGAGGTQRAPRLIGAEAALRLMLSGQPVVATAAQAMGLVDAVVDEGLWVAAVALAAEMAAEGTPPRRTCDRRDGMQDAAAYQAAVAAARAGLSGRLPAPARIVDCVEAAQLLSFDQGLAFERAAFEDLVNGPESAGLRHAFLAERRVAAFPEAAAVPERVIGQVGLVGLGQRGAALAVQLLRAGLRVTAVARDSGALVSGLGRVAELQEQAVAAGRMTEAARDADWERLVPAADLSALADSDLVIEALPEDEVLKAQVLTALTAVVPPGVVIATSVSWLDPAVLAEVSGRAGDVVGLHLGLSGPSARAAEIGVAPSTQAAAVVALVGVMRRIGRLPVRVRAAEGMVGCRLMAALRTAADLLVDAGARPGEVDAALVDFGFAVGPYEALDRMGLERDWAQRQRLAEAGRPVPAGDLLDLLVSAGRLGQETGRGYYLHAEGGPREDPEMLALLTELRAAKGVSARRIGSEDIRLRCLSAMANEGARVLGEGGALRAGDVDVAMIAGYGFPRWEGGPMAWAAGRGLLVLRADLRRFAPEAPAFWAVAPLIDRLIRDGKGFGDIDLR